MTIDERKKLFITNGTKKWGDMYDYSLVDYKNARTKVELTRKDNGVRFWMTPELHLRYGGGIIPCRLEYGHWNDKSVCYEESKKYKNKHEFQRQCYGAYNSAFKHGWLDEFFDGKNETLYHDFSEKIHCVYVYEITELNACYVGRTSRIGVRDRQHRNGVLRHGKKEYDTLYRFCQDNGVKIPSYKILEDELTAEQSQEEEARYVREYQESGWNVINKGKVGVGIGSLGSVVKWNHDKCLCEAKKYKSKEELKKSCPSAYAASYRGGWLSEFYPQLAKRKDGYWEDYSHCKEAALMCNSSRELKTKFGGAYNAIRRNGWKDLIMHYPNVRRND